MYAQQQQQQQQQQQGSGLTHERGKAESKTQSQGYLAGHAAPVPRLSEEDDGAEEGHHQREEQRETQQRVVGFHQRRAKVHSKHHLGNQEEGITPSQVLSSLLSATNGISWFPPTESHPDTDGDQSSDGRDGDESDSQRLSKGQVLNDFWDTGIVSIIGPVLVTAQDTCSGICQRGRNWGLVWKRMAPSGSKWLLKHDRRHS